MTIVSGHQPTYLPWLGLIHKAMLCDVFVFMDDVQYLEQDWNNRNTVKSSNGKKLWLTVPVDLKNSNSKILKDILIKDESNINERKRWTNQHWNTLKSSYGKSNFFKDYKDFFEDLYMVKKWTHLSELNLYVFENILKWFNIDCKIEIASQFNFIQKKSDLVLEHGLRFDANIVVTGMHGKDYIKVDDFKAKNINVYFQEFIHPEYEQRFDGFVSHLSFLDLLFNIGPQEGKKLILESNISKEELCKTFN